MTTAVASRGTAILLHPHPMLSRRSEPVTEFDDGLAALAGRMAAACRAIRAFGLAACQIGVPARMFVYAERSQHWAVVNPVLAEESEETLWGPEGCLSLPGGTVQVERPRSVLLRGENLDGEPLEVEAEGMLARVFCHEIDHLNGRLTIDRVSRQQRRQLLRRLEKVRP